MPPLQGVVTFPGIASLLDASYTLQHGTAPGVCTLTIVPQATPFASIGPLEWTFGTQRIVFPGCRVVGATLQSQGDGLRMVLAIQDRRWAWQFGRISGRFNVVLPDGTREPTTERTARELARLCLAAMGETRFDANQVPADVFPSVEWDYDNPAQALEELLDPLGLRVVLGLDNRVRLLHAGVGGPLPALPGVTTENYTLDPPETPDEIVVVGGPALWQHDFALEAVGKELDGRYVPIAQLSYAPDPLAADGGWSTIDLPEMNQIADLTLREVARESVFRCFRIPHTEPVAEVRDYGRVSQIWQLLPVRNVLCQTINDEHDAGPRPLTESRFKRAVLWGAFYDGQDRFENTVAANAAIPDEPDEATTYKQPWSLDAETGIVTVGEPLYYWTQGANGYTTTIPDLRLRCSFHLRDASGRLYRPEFRKAAKQPQRKGPRQPPKRSTKLVKYIKADDLVLLTYADTTGAALAVAPVVNNHGDLQREALKLLAAEEAKFVTVAPYTLTYAGLHRIEPDGAIQSVRWSVGEGGAFTVASLNDERTNNNLPPYAQRRFLQRIGARLNRFDGPQPPQDHIQQVEG